MKKLHFFEIFQKSEVFEFEKATEFEVITSEICPTPQNFGNTLYFQTHITKSLSDFKGIF